MEPQDYDKPIIGIRVPVNGLIMILKFYAWNRSISILQLDISCLKFSPVPSGIRPFSYQTYLPFPTNVEGTKQAQYFATADKYETKAC